jgi:hypothetical protein
MTDKNRAWMRQKDVDDLEQDAGWCNVYSYEPAPPSHAATLVVHQGPHERVFTESEVRAALRDAMALGFTRDEKCNILKDVHGIVLDPA